MHTVIGLLRSVALFALYILPFCCMICLIGFFALVTGNVQVLVFRNNRITSTVGLDRLFAVEQLDLAFNLLSDISEVSRLDALPNLDALWLSGNPLSFMDSYRTVCLQQLGYVVFSRVHPLFLWPSLCRVIRIRLFSSPSLIF